MTAGPLNLNHRCRVRVTAAGRKAWDAFHRDLGVEPPALREDGALEDQLWCIMQVFGSHLHNGCRVPIETEIEVLE